MAARVGNGGGRAWEDLGEGLGECETTSGRIDRIGLELNLEGTLDTEQRERLQELVDKYPVKRTLGSEVLAEIIRRASEPGT